MGRQETGSVHGACQRCQQKFMSRARVMKRCREWFAAAAWRQRHRFRRALRQEHHASTCYSARRPTHTLRGKRLFIGAPPAGAVRMRVARCCACRHKSEPGSYVRRARAVAKGP